MTFINDVTLFWPFLDVPPSPPFVTSGVDVIYERSLIEPTWVPLSRYNCNVNTTPVWFQRQHWLYNVYDLNPNHPLTLADIAWHWVLSALGWICPGRFQFWAEMALGDFSFGLLLIILRYFGPPRGTYKWFEYTVIINNIGIQGVYTTCVSWPGAEGLIRNLTVVVLM